MLLSGGPNPGVFAAVLSVSCKLNTAAECLTLFAELHFYGTMYSTYMYNTVDARIIQTKSFLFMHRVYV